MIDTFNRFAGVTNPAGPDRQHAILFLVAVDHDQSCKMLPARIVVQVVIFEAERTDRRHLRDVFP
jgi:hypothetical protein